jgi:hypothetical protein
MKRCPICNRRYSDDSLNFCLDDGANLLTVSEPEPTLIIPGNTSPIAARWTASPSQSAQSSRAPNRWIWFLAIFVLAVVMGGGAVALVYEMNKRPPSTGAASSGTPTPSVNTKTTRPSPEVSPSPSAEVSNLTGEWNVVNTIEETSYPSYANLRIGYRLVINQSGTAFTAEGEKVSENGRTIIPAERSPIHLTGSVDGDKVGATYTEEGERRKTSGRFAWTIEAEGTRLRGTFVSTAASSSGSSVATRQR